MNKRILNIPYFCRPRLGVGAGGSFCSFCEPLKRFLGSGAGGAGVGSAFAFASALALTTLTFGAAGEDGFAFATEVATLLEVKQF